MADHIPPTYTPALMEALRVRAGLQANDNSKDAEITAAFNGAVVWLEDYLDRFLVGGNYVETFVHKRGEVISLKGYPVVQINDLTSLSPDSVDTTAPYHLDRVNGLVHFDGVIAEHELQIDYDTDDALSGVLMMAATKLFDVIWAGFNSSGGTVATGAVKSISSDGARVEFDVGSGSSSSASGIDSSTGLPAGMDALLNVYRRYQC